MAHHCTVGQVSVASKVVAQLLRTIEWNAKSCRIVVKNRYAKLLLAFDTVP